MSPPANFPFASERKYFDGVLSIVSLPLTEEYITELIIYSNISSWNNIEKKYIYGHVGTQTYVTSLSSQLTTCYELDHHASPKKDASSVAILFLFAADSNSWCSYGISPYKYHKTLLLLVDALCCLYIL